MDINLEEAWLIKLNSLKYFKRVSICEGHFDEDGNECPHIALKLKYRKSFDIPEFFKTKSDDLQQMFKKYFDKRLAWVRLHYYNEVSAIHQVKNCLCFFCNSLVHRISDQPDELLYYFFDDSIDKILKVEKFFDDYFAAQKRSRTSRK